MLDHRSQTGINVLDLLRLSAIPGVGTNRLRALISHFGSPTAALAASPVDLARVEGIEKRLASTIVHFEGGGSFAEEQLSLLNRANGRIVTLWDEEYPEYLRKIYDPPPFLFVRGAIEQNDRFSIAIVGTRLPSQYGKLAAERFAQELSEKGITIVSGLARGIDTIAHCSCLKSGGRTIAVIGSGIDLIYPPENLRLAEQIENHGAIVSECYMGAAPDAGNFPRRNRLVSGMTLGTLIVETPENGGAMITASTALDQNRELFCVPGNITEKNSIGTNLLIRDGRAKLVVTVDDILAELEPALRPILKKSSPQAPVQLSIFEHRLLELLGSEPLHIDLLSEKSGLSMPDTLVNMLGLEFKGMVRQLAGKMFVKL